MSAHVSDSALRMAASAMLADKSAHLTLANNQWIGATLLQDTLSQQERQVLIDHVLRWAQGQAPDVAVALRRALGEDIPRDPVPRTTTAPASADTPARATTPSNRRRNVQSITDLPTEENTVMTPDFERELAIVTKEFERPPYWFPSKTKRLAEAEALVRAGKVHRLPDGSYHVDGSKGRRYACLHGESCTCEDSTTHGESKWCKHLIAIDLYDEVQARLQPALFPPMVTVDERLAGNAPVTLQDAREEGETIQASVSTKGSPETIVEPPRGPEEPAVDARDPEKTPLLTDAQLKMYRQTLIHQLEEFGVHPDEKSSYADAVMTHVGLLLVPENLPLITERFSQLIIDRTRHAPPPIPRHYLVEIKGKKHVLFSGLLTMAHERGLINLTAEFVSVTAELALAKAQATFADGRTFTEAADATPGNVGPQVKPHFARMALTRAKARCLRDALNISATSYEEVVPADEEEGKGGDTHV